MQVTQIAKLAEKTNAEVAAAFDIPQEGTYWFKTVDDTAAREYIEAQSDTETPPEPESTVEEQPEPPVVEPEPEPEPVTRKRAQFWSSNRSHFLPSKSTETRGDIKFVDWKYVTDDDSAEAAFLRSVDIRDRIGVREILDKPYTEFDVGVAFQTYLNSLIYTGNTIADGHSREGVQCVAAMLSSADEAEMETLERSIPELLVKAVVRRKSMNAEAFGK